MVAGIQKVSPTYVGLFSALLQEALKQTKHRERASRTALRNEPSLLPCHSRSVCEKLLSSSYFCPWEDTIPRDVRLKALERDEGLWGPKGTW